MADNFDANSPVDPDERTETLGATNAESGDDSVVAVSKLDEEKDYINEDEQMAREDVIVIDDSDCEDLDAAKVGHDIMVEDIDIDDTPATDQVFILEEDVDKEDSVALEDKIIETNPGCEGNPEDEAEFAVEILGSEPARELEPVVSNSDEADPGDDADGAARLLESGRARVLEPVVSRTDGAETVGQPSTVESPVKDGCDKPPVVQHEQSDDELEVEEGGEPLLPSHEQEQDRVDSTIGDSRPIRLDEVLEVEASHEAEHVSEHPVEANELEIAGGSNPTDSRDKQATKTDEPVAEVFVAKHDNPEDDSLAAGEQDKDDNVIVQETPNANDDTPHLERSYDGEEAGTNGANKPVAAEVVEPEDEPFVTQDDGQEQELPAVEEQSGGIALTLGDSRNVGTEDGERSETVELVRIEEIAQEGGADEPALAEDDASEGKAVVGKLEEAHNESLVTGGIRPTEPISADDAPDDAEGKPICSEQSADGGQPGTDDTATAEALKLESTKGNIQENEGGKLSMAEDDEADEESVLVTKHVDPENEPISAKGHGRDDIVVTGDDAQDAKDAQLCSEECHDATQLGNNNGTSIEAVNFGSTEGINPEDGTSPSATVEDIEPKVVPVVPWHEDPREESLVGGEQSREGSVALDSGPETSTEDGEQVESVELPCAEEVVWEHGPDQAAIAEDAEPENEPLVTHVEDPEEESLDVEQSRGDAFALGHGADVGTEDGERVEAVELVNTGDFAQENGPDGLALAEDEAVVPKVGEAHDEPLNRHGSSQDDIVIVDDMPDADEEPLFCEQPQDTDPPISNEGERVESAEVLNAEEVNLVNEPEKLIISEDDKAEESLVTKHEDDDDEPLAVEGHGQDDFIVAADDSPDASDGPICSERSRDAEQLGIDDGEAVKVVEIESAEESIPEDGAENSAWTEGGDLKDEPLIASRDNPEKVSLHVERQSRGDSVTFGNEPEIGIDDGEPVKPIELVHTLDVAQENRSDKATLAEDDVAEDEAPVAELGEEQDESRAAGGENDCGAVSADDAPDIEGEVLFPERSDDVTEQRNIEEDTGNEVESTSKEEDSSTAGLGDTVTPRVPESVDERVFVVGREAKDDIPGVVENVAGEQPTAVGYHHGVDSTGIKSKEVSAMGDALLKEEEFESVYVGEAVVREESPMPQQSVPSEKPTFAEETVKPGPMSAHDSGEVEKPVVTKNLSPLASFPEDIAPGEEMVSVEDQPGTEDVLVVSQDAEPGEQPGQGTVAEDDKPEGESVSVREEATNEAIEVVGAENPEPGVEPGELAVGEGAEFEVATASVAEAAADEPVEVVDIDDTKPDDQPDEAPVAEDNEPEGETVSVRDRTADEAIEVVGADDAEANAEGDEPAETEGHEPEAEAVSLGDEAADEAVEVVNAEDAEPCAPYEAAELASTGDEPSNQLREAVVAEDDEPEVAEDDEPEGEKVSVRDSAADEAVKLFGAEDAEPGPQLDEASGAEDEEPELDTVSETESPTMGASAALAKPPVTDEVVAPQPISVLDSIQSGEASDVQDRDTPVLAQENNESGASYIFGDDQVDPISALETSAGEDNTVEPVVAVADVDLVIPVEPTDQDATVEEEPEAAIYAAPGEATQSEEKRGQDVGREDATQNEELEDRGMHEGDPDEKVLHIEGQDEGYERVAFEKESNFESGPLQKEGLKMQKAVIAEVAAVPKDLADASASICEKQTEAGQLVAEEIVTLGDETEEGSDTGLKEIYQPASVKKRATSEQAAAVNEFPTFEPDVDMQDEPTNEENATAEEPASVQKAVDGEKSVVEQEVVLDEEPSAVEGAMAGEDPVLPDATVEQEIIDVDDSVAVREGFVSDDHASMEHDNVEDDVARDGEQPPVEHLDVVEEPSPAEDTTVVVGDDALFVITKSLLAVGHVMRQQTSAAEGDPILPAESSDLGQVSILEKSTTAEDISPEEGTTSDNEPVERIVPQEAAKKDELNEAVDETGDGYEDERTADEEPVVVGVPRKMDTIIPEQVWVPPEEAMAVGEATTSEQEPIQHEVFVHEEETCDEVPAFGETEALGKPAHPNEVVTLGPVADEDTVLVGQPCTDESVASMGQGVAAAEDLPIIPGQPIDEGDTSAIEGGADVGDATPDHAAAGISPVSASSNAISEPTRTEAATQDEVGAGKCEPSQEPSPGLTDQSEDIVAVDATSSLNLSAPLTEASDEPSRENEMSISQRMLLATGWTVFGLVFFHILKVSLSAISREIVPERLHPDGWTRTAARQTGAVAMFPLTAFLQCAKSKPRSLLLSVMLTCAIFCHFVVISSDVLVFADEEIFEQMLHRERTHPIFALFSVTVWKTVGGLGLLASLFLALERTYGPALEQGESELPLASRIAVWWLVGLFAVYYADRLLGVITHGITDIADVLYPIYSLVLLFVAVLSVR